MKLSNDQLIMIQMQIGNWLITHFTREVLKQMTWKECVAKYWEAARKNK